MRKKAMIGTMRKSRKAQVSVEFIFIVSIVIVFSIILWPTIIKANELNRGVAAARDGATFGATMRGLGYDYEGKDYPSGTITIDRLDYEIIQTGQKKNNVSITIYVRGPSYFTYDQKVSITSTIRNQAQRYVGKTFSGDFDTSVDNRQGSYYIFAPISCGNSTWINY